MSDRNRPEQRRYKRIQKHFILTYFNMADPHQKHDASQLKDISQGGMCLITAQAYEPNTLLGIELKTPFLSQLTHLEGRVCQSDEKIKDIIYETHLEFTNVTPQAETVLIKTIAHFEKETD